MTQPKRPPSGSALTARLSSQEAADHVGRSIRTWRRWLQMDPRLRAIMHLDPAGRRYWLADELDAWQREPAPEPIHPPAPHVPRPGPQQRRAAVTLARQPLERPAGRTTRHVIG